jgi:16S rRNA (adenine1518-N6/adenine1519-N6)-dimethyltransferase
MPYRDGRPSSEHIYEAFVKAKQSLGQNFLVNQAITERMASFAGITGKDTVLEIGPGRGILTRTLLRHASRVIAVEKDDNLFALLGEAFRGMDALELIHADILDCDLPKILRNGIKIVATLPYNIGTQFIMRLVQHAGLISSVVVMLQKEVAERICAGVGEKEYSALTVIMASGFDAVSGFIVGPANFSPRPKVDSQVLKLLPRIDPISGHDLEILKKVVYCAFSQRRKVLRNTLMQLPRLDEESLQKIAGDAGINLRSRPQEISMESFHVLSRAYEQYLKSI